MNADFVNKYFTPLSILDIGANIGEFYRTNVNIFPDAYFYLIEADGDCESQLKSLGVDYFIGALSDKEGEAVFFKTKTRMRCTGNSLYREQTHYYNDDNIIEITVPTFTLEKLFPEKRFDLIKLDVQGSELDIIRGGIDVIKAAKGIILEMSVMEYNKNAPLEDEVGSFMESIGFEAKQVVGINTHPELHILIQKDVFWVNKNLGVI